MAAQKEPLVDFDAVKGLSLSEFLSGELNVVPRKVGSSTRFATCPSCGDSASASSNKLTISKDDRTWHCFSCGEHGSILDAAMLLWGCSLIQAAKQLLGVRDEFRASSLPKIDRSAELAAIAARTAKMRQAFMAIQHACAEFQDEAEPLSYLVDNRKIPLRIVREAQRRGMVGFLPSDSNKAKDVLLSAVGEDLLRETELWKPDKKLPGISYRPLVFFLPNLSSAEFRLIGEVKEGWTKSIRYGALEYPYWWQGTDAQCMIVEGAIDLMSAVALGFNGHVLGLTGCNTFNDDWFPAAAKRHGIKRFVIALDNDVNRDVNPGQVWAQKLNELITSQGIPCFVKTPERGDINDILKARFASSQ